MGLSVECEKALGTALEQLAAGQVDQLGFDIAAFSSEADRRLLGHVEAIHSAYRTMLAQNERFAVGDFAITNDSQSGPARRSTEAVASMFADIVGQADAIARGDYAADIRPKSDQDRLGIALQTMTETLRGVGRVCEKVATGDTSEKLEVKGENDLLALAVNQVVDTLKDAADQANVIARGDFDADIRPRGDQDRLGIALQAMTETLRGVGRVCEKVATGDVSEKVEIKGARDLLGVAINQVVDTLANTASQANAIARGDYSADIAPRSDKDSLGLSLRVMTDNLRQIAGICTAIAAGDLKQDVKAQGPEDELGNAISAMVATLVEAETQVERERWLKNGEAETLERLRGEQDPSSIAQSVLTHLAKYVGAQTGIFYVADQGGTMSLTSSYACAQKSGLRKEFALGEGIVGQAVLERQAVENMDISRSPMGAAHGGGEVSLTNLGIFPLLADDTVQAAIQLASMDPLSESSLELIKIVSENIAIAIATANNRGKMQEMLEEAQRQSEEMQQQAEQLRTTNEEMEEQTKRLRRSEEELKSQQTELQATN